MSHSAREISAYFVYLFLTIFLVLLSFFVSSTVFTKRSLWCILHLAFCFRYWFVVLICLRGTKEVKMTMIDGEWDRCRRWEEGCWDAELWSSVANFKCNVLFSITSFYIWFQFNFSFIIHLSTLIFLCLICFSCVFVC